jgi:hypothetical protein
LDASIWGIVIIDAERITYRYRNVESGTISGLMRGTAGTAVTEHATGATVYNLGRNNLLPKEYQDYIVSDSTLGNGSTTEFTAPDITASVDEIEVFVGGIRITSGFSFISTDPVTIQFDTVSAGNLIIGQSYTITTIGTTDFTLVGASCDLPPGPCNSVGQFFVATQVGAGTGTATLTPPAGVEVLILVRRGVTWYERGFNTASDGRPLQDTNTQAASFLRGG